MNDTHQKVAAVQIDLLRKAGATRRSTIALRLSTDVIDRSRRALASAMPGASEQEVKLRWVELWYGAELAARLRSHLRAKEPHRHEAKPDGE